MRPKDARINNYYLVLLFNTIIYTIIYVSNFYPRFEKILPYRLGTFFHSASIIYPRVSIFYHLWGIFYPLMCIFYPKVCIFCPSPKDYRWNELFFTRLYINSAATHLNCRRQLIPTVLKVNQITILHAKQKESWKPALFKNYS